MRILYMLIYNNIIGMLAFVKELNSHYKYIKMYFSSCFRIYYIIFWQ